MGNKNTERNILDLHVAIYSRLCQDQENNSETCLSETCSSAPLHCITGKGRHKKGGGRGSHMIWVLLSSTLKCVAGKVLIWPFSIEHYFLQRVIRRERSDACGTDPQEWSPRCPIFCAWVTFWFPSHSQHFKKQRAALSFDPEITFTSQSLTQAFPLLVDRCIMENLASFNW